MTPFTNEPILDFSKDENRRAIEAAIADAQRKFGRDLPIVIGGKRITTKDKIRRTNPCDPSELIATVSKADRAMAEDAVRTAQKAFESWSRVPAEKRADVLFKGAAIMRKRRFEIDATMVLEVSKSWVEADADTAEAIDFLEFYGREMLRYAGENPVTPVAGEKNRLEYIPLGIGVVIAPWNFPCAILAGMTTAAVVTGNTVIMKPASAAPVIAHLTFEILEEAGVPPGVVNYVPCSGGEVGDMLVDHPLTRFVSFTGSKEVGIRIYERAARVNPGQRWLKRVVAEMGGKDAIVVDECADLEAASSGAVAAAYGFQGQKCSACSRLIATAPVYDKLVALVKEKTEKLKVGDVRKADTNVGAVVDEGAYRKILDYIAVGSKEGRVVAGGGPAKDAGPGYFIQPTVIADVAESARIAQEEIFGPVLAVIKAKDLDDALRIANGTEYGLTGAIYCRNREHLAKATREFHVGNLYVNRKCTGALVGAHPFGGFNMSGTDSKAGGRDYLLLFLQAKSVSEKV
jgi:1-pyrroline-5-carboxylate dehydrogenase